MESGVGKVVYCAEPYIRLSYKLSDHCRNFQAEVFAIEPLSIRTHGKKETTVDFW